jgi:mannitol 2-dehydrogenase
LEVALWCAYCASSADGEIDHALDDERADLLKDAAVKARTDPVRFLQMNDVFGDLGASPVFADAFGRQLQQVESLGARAALLAYLDIQGAAKATAM